VSANPSKSASSHVEARDRSGVKYRIDGVLQHAMTPISKDWHSPVISRIKVLSDLDIAERRVPQDGRFRVSTREDLLTSRFHHAASHGEDAVLRVLARKAFREIPEA